MNDSQEKYTNTIEKFTRTIEKYTRTIENILLLLSYVKGDNEKCIE